MSAHANATPIRGQPFRLLKLADLRKLPPREHILSGLLGAGEVSLWWGKPKTGKSFLLLRLSYGLAVGRGMWGRVPAGVCPAVYVGHEGRAGLPARIEALADEHGETDDFACLVETVLFGANANDLLRLIPTVQAHGAKLVVIDTVAQVFDGDSENEAVQMGHFCRAMRRLADETGAHVALIHHGENHPRGSRALVAAVDLIVQVTRTHGKCSAVVEDARDDAAGLKLPFHLRDVVVRDRGREATTLIAEEAEGAAPEAPQSRALPGGADQALAALRKAGAEHGRPVAEKTWRQATYASAFAELRPSARQKAFQRAKAALLGAGAIEAVNGAFQVTERRTCRT